MEPPPIAVVTWFAPINNGVFSSKLLSWQETCVCGGLRVILLYHRRRCSIRQRREHGKTLQDIGVQTLWITQGDFLWFFWSLSTFFQTPTFRLVEHVTLSAFKKLAVLFELYPMHCCFSVSFRWCEFRDATLHKLLGWIYVKNYRCLVSFQHMSIRDAPQLCIPWRFVHEHYVKPQRIMRCLSVLCLTRGGGVPKKIPTHPGLDTTYPGPTPP